MKNHPSNDHGWYQFDESGQPKDFSQRDVIVISLIPPLLLGIALGIGLAISLHPFSPSKPQKAVFQSTVQTQETAP
jgi:hypothetical protein